MAEPAHRGGGHAVGLGGVDADGRLVFTQGTTASVSAGGVAVTVPASGTLRPSTGDMVAIVVTLAGDVVTVLGRVVGTDEHDDLQIAFHPSGQEGAAQIAGSARSA